jgi:beta-glucosidase-like glycosyl hydrolase
MIDAFSMQAVYASKDGLENTTVKAINVGVDLILSSSDKDLDYEALHTLIQAEKAGKLEIKSLNKSKTRLEKSKSQNFLVRSRFSSWQA